MQQYIDLTIDFAKRNDRLNGITLDRVTTRSYDTAIKFRIEIVGHVLDATYGVKILTKYHKSGLSVMTTLGGRLEIADGKLIYTPKVNLITEADYVRNFLYLSKDGLGLDMAQFNYEVDLSEIDKTALEVKLVYDQSYEALIAEFEQALEDYKLTLPQASELRAEIDVILNQFGVDSQAKLLQWEQGADALLKTVEGNESARVDAETTRKTAETDRVSSETTRKSNETARISNEDERKSAEVIRLASELDRVNAENVRSAFYEGFESELDKKANKVQEDWITPTLLNGWGTHPFYGIVKYFKNSLGDVHIKGHFDGTNANSNHALTLPLNYRPDGIVYFLSDSIFGGPSSIVKATISTEGNLIIPIGSRVAFYIIYRAGA